MILPYWEELRDDQARFLPLIPISIHGPTDSVELLALVDSGAEHSVLSIDFAKELGISLTHATRVAIVGVGEQEVPGLMTTVELQLGRYQWPAPVIFAAGHMRRPLLGQIGFFAFFTVTFRYDKREISIRRNR
jgi:hypothetical protein